MKKIMLFCLMFLIMPLFATNIYNGDGTDYPTGIDDYTIQSAASYWTYPKQNDIGKCLVAIETELGTSPSGGYGTVKDRLNAIAISTSAWTSVGTFRSSMTVIEGQYVNKISTGNIYKWNSATNNITKQSDAYIVYGSTYMHALEALTININGITEILNFNVQHTVAGTAASSSFYLYTTSITVARTDSGEAYIYWQAIVR